MSVNTIATSPSGGLIPPAAPAANAPCDADELDDDDDEPVELVDDGRVHEPYMLDGPWPFFAPPVPPEWPDDDDVWLVDVAPADVESPCMADRRVMISRKVGRIVGSVCQQLVISSSYSVGYIKLSPAAGMVGRIPSRMTATATAAGLRPK
jgi:hypothetical protein